MRSVCHWIQVPSFGVLSTGTKSVFFKFEPQSKTLYESGPFLLPLKKRISARNAKESALPVVELLVYIIKEQKKAFVKYKQADC